MDEIAQLNSSLAGRYAVEREIGAGGMATVFLARDLRHDRQVALKVLKPELGAVLGAERFLSEIKVTARLQHPNLLPLFDSGEANGLLFYVMPFVEGESLRARLDREKLLPVDEAVRIAVAVATALDYAHGLGVIHRDLKPENILLQAGQPVVADFGIALAVSKAGGARVTQTGLSLGTPQYMSPEQATGDRMIDGRSDIYSLAAVTYEMLTGEPPHTGATAQAIIARVLTEQPRSVRASRPNVPEHVELAVEGGLEKLAADRWPTAGDFANALRGTASVLRPSRAALSSAAGSRRAADGWRAPLRSPLVLALAAVALAGAVFGGWEWRAAHLHVDGKATRFTLAMSPAQRFQNVNGNPVALSPDGRAIVYVGLADRGTMLYYRPLDQLIARPLPGTENTAGGVFSPDGQRILFFPLDKMKILSVSGGGATTIEQPAEGAAWAGTDIVYGSTSGLFRIPAIGGTPERLTTADSARGELGHSGPIVLDDGKTVLFWIRAANPQDGRLGLFSLDRRQLRKFDGLASSPLGVFDRYVLFGKPDGTISAARFDAAASHTLDNEMVVLEKVLWKFRGGTVASMSHDGSLVYAHGSSAEQLDIVDEHGARIGGSGAQGEYSDPQISPDGRRIALTVSSGDSQDIWVYDMASAVLSRVTSLKSCSRPVWTPDGKRIAFVKSAGLGFQEAWWVPADGSGREERFHAMAADIHEIAFSPDGKYALFRTGASAVAAAPGIWLLPLAGARTATPLVQTNFATKNPAVSPDGRWLAYSSNETGRPEIYVRSFPDAGGRVQLSSGGGFNPQWLNDGRLIYETGEALVAASLSAAAPLHVLSSKPLFNHRAYPASHPQYGVQANGERFVILRSVSDDSEVVVVLNWRAELRTTLAQAVKR